MTVAHAILTTIYYIVRRGTVYQDLGANYHKLLNRERVLKKRVRELAGLGYEITVRDFQSELGRQLSTAPALTHPKSYFDPNLPHE